MNGSGKFHQDWGSTICQGSHSNSCYRLSSNLAYLLKTISSSHNVFNCPLECILFLSFLMHTLLFGLSAAAYSRIIL